MSMSYNDSVELLIPLNRRGNDLPPIYAGWLRFNFSFLVLSALQILNAASVMRSSGKQ